jgi:hypothetical protein
MPTTSPTADAKLASIKAAQCVPVNVVGALAVLFPGIDLVKDAVVMTVNGAQTIVEWNRPEDQPTLAQLRLVVIPPPPITITARQARLWLLAAGMNDASVIAQINAMPDPAQRAAAMVHWEYSATILSNAPLVTLLAPALGLTTPAQIHAAFTAAQAL